MQKEYFDTLKKTKKDNTKTPEFIIEDNKELLAKIEKSYTDLKALSEEKIIIVEQLYKQIEIFAKDLDIKISKAENEYKDSSIKDDDSQQDDYSYSNSAYASRHIKQKKRVVTLQNSENQLTHPNQERLRWTPFLCQSQRNLKI